MGRAQYDPPPDQKPVWNAGKKVGAKRALKQKQIWQIRFHSDCEHRLPDRALFDLAIGSKLKGCDLVKIKIGTLVIGPEIRTLAIVILKKTGHPVQFEIMTDARASLLAWLDRRGGKVDDYVFFQVAMIKRHISASVNTQGLSMNGFQQLTYAKKNTAPLR